MAIVIASYAPKMTEQRELRIVAALKRCNVRLVVTDDETGEVYGSDVEWLASDDDTETELTIHVGDDMARAARLASELRTCGLVANVESEGHIA